MSQLVYQIFNLQKDIEKHIDCINEGGCVHFAYYFSKKLSLLKIINHIVFLDKNHPIKISYRDFEAFNHAMVFIPDIGYIDGRKTAEDIKDLGYIYKRSKISLVKLDNFRNMRGMWSSDYDVKQNYLLQKLIDEHIR